MSDETQDDGCGADPRAGWSAEDLFCGGPLVIDERIATDVQAAVADLEERQRGERLAVLLALVRPPDDQITLSVEHHARWNLVGTNDIVILMSRPNGMSLLLAQYGTDDYAEILKRFSDPEFRAAHNLDKRPDFGAATRDIARS